MATTFASHESRENTTSVHHDQTAEAKHEKDSRHGEGNANFSFIRSTPSFSFIGNELNSESEQNKKEPISQAKGDPKKPKEKKIKYKGLLKPKDNFSGRSKKKFGVGEQIDLDVKTNHPVAAITNMQWSVEAGNAAQLLPHAAKDGKGTFKAGDTGEHVTLSLKNADTNQVITRKKFEIVEPTDKTFMKKASNIAHTHGQPDVGFKGEIYLRPKKVSFAGIRIRENTVAGIGTGYYLAWNGIAHPITAGLGIPVAVPTSASEGSKALGQDTVYSGYFPGKAVERGEFTWNIPWEFKVGTGPWKQYTIATHHQHVNKHGKTTIGKKGAGPFSKRLNEPTTGY